MTGLTAVALSPPSLAAAPVLDRSLEATIDKPCPDIIVIGARGSGEQSASDPDGSPYLGLGREVYSVTSGIVGQLGGSALTVGYVPVNYASAPVSTLVPSGILSKKFAQALAFWIPDNLNIYLASITEGITVARDILSRDAVRCPNSRFVLAGYSQGAMVMHQLTLQLASEKSGLLNRVRSIALVADGDQKKATGTIMTGSAPFNAEGVRSFVFPGEKDIPQALRNSTYSLCDDGDIVCDFTKDSLTPVTALLGVGIHMGYDDDRLAKIGRLIGMKIVNRAWILTSALPAAGVGQDYSASLAGTGTGSLTWTATTALPPGLLMSRSGILSGRPTSVGTYALGIQLTDSVRQTARVTLSLVVSPTGTAPPLPGCESGCSVTLIGEGGLTLTQMAATVVDFGDVTQIAGGGFHMYALRRDGTVWALGNNSQGQLGNATLVDSVIPVQVLGLSSGVLQVAASDSGGLALMRDGTVWGWGDNSDEQLVTGGPATISSPVQIVGLSGVRQVAGGGTFTVALKADGTVWMQGTAGLGSVHKPIPTQVAGATDIVSISARGPQSYGVRSDGTAWSWAYPHLGSTRLGPWDADQVTGVTSILQVSASSTYGDGHALATDGSVYGWGENYWGEVGDGTTTARLQPVRLPGLSNIVAIADGGGRNGYALTASGTVLGWGGNYGQFTVSPDGSTNLSNPTPVAGAPAVAVRMAPLFNGIAILGRN